MNHLPLEVSIYIHTYILNQSSSLNRCAVGDVHTYPSAFRGQIVNFKREVYCDVVSEFTPHVEEHLRVQKEC